MKNKLHAVIKVVSVLIILYAIGLKTMPESMPFSHTKSTDDFYAPHAGQCVPELEF
jgi:hypothetical protein